MVIAFCVSVPVLSVHMIDTAHNVSIAVRERTIAFFHDMLRAPIDNINESIAGNHSGIQDTRDAIPNIIVSKRGLFER
jgi:uncharacterized protein YunC (DUF1805 family)